MHNFLRKAAHRQRPNDRLTDKPTLSHNKQTKNHIRPKITPCRLCSKHSVMIRVCGRWQRREYKSQDRKNCLRSAGSLFQFHTRGAATQNARSPNFRFVRGTMKSPRLAVRRAGRPGTSAADVSRSLMYAGE